MHNSFGVKSYLANHGIPIDTSCPLCHDQVESISHALRDCQVIKPVWLHLGIHNSNSLFFSQDIRTWLASNTSVKTTQTIKGVP